MSCPASSRCLVRRPFRKPERGWQALQRHVSIFVLRISEGIFRINLSGVFHEEVAVKTGKCFRAMERIPPMRGRDLYICPIFPQSPIPPEDMLCPRIIHQRKTVPFPSARIGNPPRVLTVSANCWKNAHILTRETHKLFRRTLSVDMIFTVCFHICS